MSNSQHKCTSSCVNKFCVTIWFLHSDCLHRISAKRCTMAQILQAYSYRKFIKLCQIWHVAAFHLCCVHLCHPFYDQNHFPGKRCPHAKGKQKGAVRALTSLWENTRAPSQPIPFTSKLGTLRVPIEPCNQLTTTCWSLVPYSSLRTGPKFNRL